MTDRELFIQAFLEADEQEMHKYKNKDTFHHTFSEKFEKEMDKLIAKDKCISIQTRKKISQTLIAALIAILTLFTGLMSVSASRQKIIEFVERIFSQYTQIQLSEESATTPDTIEISYILNDVPEGFTQIQYELEETGVFAVWQNDKGEEIFFMQDILNGDFSIDNEFRYDKFDLNGYPAYIYGDDSTCFISWTDGQYWFRINAPAQYKDELMPLAKNISEKN